MSPPKQYSICERQFTTPTAEDMNVSTKVVNETKLRISMSFISSALIHCVHVCMAIDVRNSERTGSQINGHTCTQCIRAEDINVESSSTKAVQYL